MTLEKELRVEKLREKRRLLLNQHLAETSEARRMTISARLRSVCRDLFTLTKNPIYR